MQQYVKSEELELLTNIHQPRVNANHTTNQMFRQPHGCDKWWASLCRKMVSSEQVIDAYMHESRRYERDGELSCALPYYSGNYRKRKWMVVTSFQKRWGFTVLTSQFVDEIFWWEHLKTIPISTSLNLSPDPVMYGLIHACAPTVLKLT